MNMEQESVENPLETLEENVESLQEKQEDLNERQEWIDQTLASLEQDAAVRQTLEQNWENLTEAQAELENERMDALASLEQIKEQLEEIRTETNSSDAVLDMLRLLGEDISESDAILANRRAWLEECYRRIEDLSTKLGENYGSIGKFQSVSEKLSEPVSEAPEKLEEHTAQPPQNNEDAVPDEPKNDMPPAGKDTGAVQPTKTVAKADDITQTPEYQAWAKNMDFLKDPTKAAVYQSADKRTPVETERVDAVYHPGYTPQKIFKTDAQTGQALRDAEGNFVLDTRRNAGTRVPDLFMQDNDGKVFIIEDKNYSNLYNLKRNIAKQTADRRATFGHDVDITFNVAPKLTVGQAEKLQDYCENQLGVHLVWSD